MSSVALIRGINVGASTRVGMATLREALAAEGAPGARTHLQSGNVVLDVPGEDAEVAALVRRAVHAAAGLDVAVVVRSAPALAELVMADPLGAEADDPSRRFVVYLDVPPEPGVLDETLAADWAPERIVARERELVLWCPSGVRDSSLAKALGRLPEGAPTTMRNWRTTARLAELAAEG